MLQNGFYYIVCVVLLMRALILTFTLIVHNRAEGLWEFRQVPLQMKVLHHLFSPGLVIVLPAVEIPNPALVSFLVSHEDTSMSSGGFQVL